MKVVLEFGNYEGKDGWQLHIEETQKEPKASMLDMIALYGIWEDMGKLFCEGILARTIAQADKTPIEEAIAEVKQMAKCVGVKDAYSLYDIDDNIQYKTDLNYKRKGKE